MEIKNYKIGEYETVIDYDSEKNVYICRDRIDVSQRDFEGLKEYYLNKYSGYLQKEYVSKDLEKAEREMKKRIKHSLEEYFSKEKKPETVVH